MKKNVIVVAGLLIFGLLNTPNAQAGNADIRVHLGAGTIVMDKQELLLGDDAPLVSKKEVVYLPLRRVLEKMEYQISWDAEKQQVLLQKGEQTYLLTIGSNQYGRQGETVTLAAAPILVKDKTLVPVEFFTKLLGKTVEVSDGHV